MYFSYLATGVDIHTEKLHAVRPTGEYELQLRRAFGEAMRREYKDMPFSKRMTREYAELRIQRRKDLEALIKKGGETAKVMDLVFAILEESMWEENADEGFDDAAAPNIDLMAARTASLLAWAVHETGLEPAYRIHVLRELRRRVFTPLMAHDRHICFDERYPFALAVLCEVMTAALLCETDITRLNSLMRRLTPAADRFVEISCGSMLKQALVNWTAAVSLRSIARVMTDGQAMSRPLPETKWLDMLLYSYQGAGRFIDHRGAGIVTGINGADVYFLGMTAGDEAVQALGAALLSENKDEPSCLSARLTVDLGKENITGAKPVPRFKYAAVEDNSVMSARGAGAYAAIVPGGRGGFCVQIEDVPVIYACDGKSLALNGKPLSNNVCAGESDFDELRADMSVDMTPALPKDCGVRFMQRTLMLDRNTGILRVVDMVECDRPGEIKYTFATPASPKKEGGGMRVGTGYISWDAGAQEETGFYNRLDSSDMHCIKLTYPLETGSNIFNFIIERA